MADDGDDVSRATQTGTGTLFQLNGRLLEKKRCNDDDLGAKLMGSRHTFQDTARHVTFRHSSTSQQIESSVLIITQTQKQVFVSEKCIARQPPSVRAALGH